MKIRTYEYNIQKGEHIHMYRIGFANPTWQECMKIGVSTNSLRIKML